MPRAIWSGAIAFGLLNVPVRMLSAVSERGLHFNYIHAKDGGRIGYRKICKKEDSPVPDEEIVKAFEYTPGEWVEMRDEDFAAARGESHRRIEIRDFVPFEQIDPVYFERTYALAPEQGAERAYAVLARAMADSGRAAIAKFIMRDRQSLACLRVRDGRTITLERMYFSDEVRSTAQLVPEASTDVEIDDRELSMARSLIDSLGEDFEAERYADTYRDTLCEIIEAKRRGETLDVSDEERPPREPDDLAAALEASIEAAERRRSSDGAATNGAGSNGSGLGGKTREELYEIARDADLPGRSQMSKEELVRALERRD